MRIDGFIFNLLSCAQFFLAISRSMPYNSTLLGLILCERIMTVFPGSKETYIRLP